MKYHFFYLLLFIIMGSSCQPDSVDPEKLLWEDKPKVTEKPMDTGSWVPVVELSDEFNGAEIDLSKWRVGNSYNWDGSQMGGPGKFHDDNVTVADGCLQIKTTVADPSKEGKETEHWIWNGCLQSTLPICEPGYYYEARMKASDLCTTSSFWLHYQFEIDIVEAAGNSKLLREYSYKMNMSAHDHRAGTKFVSATRSVYLPDYKRSSDDFFIYGVLWTTEKLTFYLNNEKVNEFNVAGFNFDENLYLFFDTEVHVWQGVPTVAELNDPSKNTMYVDWVRVYKRID